MSDEAARQRIASDFSSNLMVEASAGSGKTHCLVTRLVEGIRQGALAPEQIVAITFTRKAAAELSLRLRRGLEESGLEGRLRERCWVGTIHSFCGHLLRQFPVEAGLTPGFQELDEAGDLALQSKVLRQALDGEAGQQALARLAPWAAGAEDLRLALAAVCDRGELDFWQPPLPEEPDWSMLLQQFAGFYEQVRGLLPPPGQGPSSCKLLGAIKRLADRLLRHRKLAASEGIRWLRDWARPPAPLMQDWGDSRQQRQQALEPVQEAAQRFCSQIVAPALQRCQERLYAQLMPFLLDLRQLCADQRRRQGLVNYNDLLLFARNLLQQHPSVRQQLQQRFRHLLVDEFQDTDPLQAEIFLLLAEDAQGLRPGSLFLVGDPKQSIYRFRHADISVVQAVTARILQTGGARLALTRSFRCSPPLCQWLDGVFGGLFPPTMSTVQAAYSALESGRSEHPPGPAVFTLTQTERRQGESLSLEAQQIAEFIAGSQRPPGDFLILTSRKAETRNYALALQARGIACAWSGEGLQPGPWTTEMLELLWVLAQPSDRVALVGLLRGPWMGHSDEELFAYHRDHGPLGLLGEVSGAGEVAESLRQLQQWRSLARTWPAASLVLFLGRQWGLAEEAEEGELEALVGALRLRQQAGLTLVQCLQELRESRHLPAPAEPLSGQGRVRIMNVHRSKGLEAPVVFLAAPARALPCQVDFLRDPELGAMMTLRSALGGRLLAQPPGWRERSQPELEFLQAEALRLLYVAATRARDQLIVGRWGGSGGAWSLLEAGLEGAPELELVAAREPTEEPALDSVHWEGQACLEPGWQRHTVSAGNQKEWLALAEVADEDPGGREWGSLIHRLLEELLRSPQLSTSQLEVLARWYCLELPEMAQHVERAVTAVERVKETALWELVESSVQRLVEVPFGHRQGQHLTFGVIDLLLQQAEGWDVVDYKTDRLRLQDLIARYAGQLEQYARSWTAITGEKVRSRQLFGVREGKLIGDEPAGRAG